MFAFADVDFRRRLFYDCTSPVTVQPCRGTRRFLLAFEETSVNTTYIRVEVIDKCHIL